VHVCCLAGFARAAPPVHSAFAGLVHLGNFTTFSAPQASSQPGGLDINDRRQIVGIFR
jgi:hypothetical protein